MGRDKKNKPNKALLKTPKGTLDFGPAQMAVRNQVLDVVRRVFTAHGYGQKGG
jgi:histidyl-tRNA synthetase